MRTPENVKDEDLCYVKVTPDYTIDEFGRIKVYKKDYVISSTTQQFNPEKLNEVADDVMILLSMGDK